MRNELTPCGALFDIMKRYGGISNKELATLVLSGKPLFNGVSPASRVHDRTWLSRFIVNAPVESLQDSYFANFASSSLRIIAALRSKKRGSLSSQQILDMISGPHGEEMVEALFRCHQDVTLYKNILKRLNTESGFTVFERAEIAMVLFVAAGCSANVRRVAQEAIEFSKAVHGAGMATPLITPLSTGAGEEGGQPLHEEMGPVPSLALVRVVNGYLSGSPFWLNPEGTEIGALAVGEYAVSDVENDVSGHHARIWEEGGSWFVQGFGSRNGTVLFNGIDHAKTTVELPEADRSADTAASQPVVINPGDELVFGASTHFIVIEGIR